jgi:GNAT superfamily N-acetyltransferase
VSAQLLIGPLEAHHDRNDFKSGSEPLDRYIHSQAGQDVRRNIAKCFVAAREGTATVIGFYTLSAASVSVVDLPVEVTKRLPRYPTLPAALIGRFAVDQSTQGQGVGRVLLFDAVRRARRSDLAAFLVLVEAKDQRAVSFYERFHFRAFVARPRSLFLPVSQFSDLSGM